MTHSSGPFTKTNASKATGVQRGWETVSLTELTARGEGVNATFVKVSFSFGEALVEVPYSE